MDSVIRKISIGADYKNDAMHYSVGQEVYGDHTIAYILFDEDDNSYNIHIKKNNEVFDTCGNLLASGRSILIFPLSTFTPPSCASITPF